MIGATGPAHPHMTRDVQHPGKQNSVGHQAKATVAEAREAGVEMPKNAQGMAAGGISRGADPASIFAALVTPEVPTDPEPPVVADEPVDVETPATEADEVTADPPLVEDTVETTATPLTLSAEEAALALLEEAAGTT